MNVETPAKASPRERKEALNRRVGQAYSRCPTSTTRNQIPEPEPSYGVVLVGQREYA